MALHPVRQTLDNGVVVIAEENHTTPAISMLAVVRAGGYEDPPGREGTAALVARLLDRGTDSRSADVIADDLDCRGASLSISAGRHQVGVGAACLVEDFAPVLAIAADVLRAPAFPEGDVETRRAELVTTIRQEDDDPASVATNEFMRRLYQGHPYGRRSRGTADSVGGLTRAELVAFHERWFGPAALTVVVVGSLPAQSMLDQVAGAFGDWFAAADFSASDVPDAGAATGRRVERVVMPEKSQADVAYGFVGLRRLDSCYMAASVMNNALGQYALGGRLGDSIRERQGMAYYVFSSLEAGFGPGPFVVRAGVAAENVERTLTSIDFELSSLLADGFTAQEIAESKQYMVGSLPRQLETNGGIASFLLNAELFGLGLDYDRRLPDQIRAVTHDAAMEAARALLRPERATIVVAGPEAPAA